MSYDYQTERPALFTDDGQRILLKIRDNAKSLLHSAGAFVAFAAFKGVTGSSWLMLASLDRLVELGELREVENPVSCAGQHRLFVDPEGRL